MLLKYNIDKLSSLVSKLPNNYKNCYIVFDMDECIGSIHGYSMILEYLNDAFQQNLISREVFNNYNQFMFNDLLNNYENYRIFRPNFIDIFTLVYFYKLLMNEKGINLVCLIYTNNGLEPLVKIVQNLINSIVGYKVIDNYVYRNSECKIDLGLIGKITKRLEHLQRCISIDIDSLNTLFFDNDNYSVFKNELGNNYIKVNPYYFYNSINLYNYYNNHIRYVLINRSYLSVFPIINNFKQNLQVLISQLVKNNILFNNDSFSLIIPSIINFTSVLPNRNSFLNNYLAATYFNKI